MKNELLHILQHSLGLDGFGQGNAYRNHYCAGDDALPKCRELVGLGFMTERKASEISGGYPVFLVTAEGRIAVATASPKPPKVSKGKARYRRYLDYSDCFRDCGRHRFREFLKWDSDPAHSWNAKGGAA